MIGLCATGTEAAPGTAGWTAVFAEAEEFETVSGGELGSMSVMAFTICSDCGAGCGA